MIIRWSAWKPIRPMPSAPICSPHQGEATWRISIILVPTLRKQSRTRVPTVNTARQSVALRVLMPITESVCGARPLTRTTMRRCLRSTGTAHSRNPRRRAAGRNKAHRQRKAVTRRSTSYLHMQPARLRRAGFSLWQW
mgnify:CR=1 FL=1